MKLYHWLAMMVGMFWVLSGPGAVQAQSRIQAARATAEFVIERFGGQAAREGVEVLTRRIEKMAVQHGEEVFLGIRKVGPQFFKVVEEAGVNGSKAVGIMARHGEGGIAWVLKRPKGMALLLEHGEEAAAVLVRHPGGVAEPLIEQCGAPAIKALQAVGPQGGRRLAMMMSEGEMAKIGRSPELLHVIGEWGEKGMEFVWKHKEALAIGTVLTAFLANPEPFINGTRDITQIVAENAIKPIASIPSDVAKEAAKGINWTLVFLVCLFLCVGTVVGIIAFLPWFQKLVALWVGGSGFGGIGLSRALASKPRPAVESPAKNGKLRSSMPPRRNESN